MYLLALRYVVNTQQLKTDFYYQFLKHSKCSIVLINTISTQYIKI